MSIHQTMRLIFLLLIIGSIQNTIAQSRLDRAIGFYNEAKQAYDRDDYPQYLQMMIAADSLLPHSRFVKYNLAAANWLESHPDKSFEMIAELIQIDTQIAFDADSVFEDIRSNEKYIEHLKMKDELNKPVVNSEIAFELEETDLHPESIAYSAEGGVFYISSLRKRKIVIYNPRKLTTEDWLTTKEISELYGVMGIKTSEDGDFIWLCSSPLPEMEGYEEGRFYKPSVFKVNLKDKLDITRFELPEGSVPGDLVLGPKGECYVSDSASPRIFRIVKNKVEVFFSGEEHLVNLQGLTIHDGHLFIADYLTGIHRLSLKKKKLTPVSIDSPFNIAGVDGMYFYDNSLITIQNGVYPFRIGRFYLEENYLVTNFEYFDKAADFLDEPTLGVIVNNDFYFVANSPWSYYENGVLQVEFINKPQIRKVQLNR